MLWCIAAFEACFKHFLTSALHFQLTKHFLLGHWLMREWRQQGSKAASQRFLRQALLSWVGHLCLVLLRKTMSTVHTNCMQMDKTCKAQSLKTLRSNTVLAFIINNYYDTIINNFSHIDSQFIAENQHFDLRSLGLLYWWVTAHHEELKIKPLAKPVIVNKWYCKQ